MNGELPRKTAVVTGGTDGIDHLVLNAGVIYGDRRLTSEGIESQFAISYLGRFRKTTRLLPLLEAAGRPRGRPHRTDRRGCKRRDDPFRRREPHDELRLGARDLQAQDTFTVELARRLAALEPMPRVTIACLKIGVVRTNIRRTFPGWMKVLVPLLLDPFLAITPSQAADAAVRLLLAEEFEGGTGALFRYIHAFKAFAPDAQTLDPTMGQRLWELSERLIAQTV